MKSSLLIPPLVVPMPCSWSLHEQGNLVSSKSRKAQRVDSLHPPLSLRVTPVIGKTSLFITRFSGTVIDKSICRITIEQVLFTPVRLT
jgi:hypothetical protein